MMPRYYRRDGTLFEDTPESPAVLQWAKMFEKHEDRIVARNRTLYGERLSTVFLGMDQSFSLDSAHTPILFETMLFAPDCPGERERTRQQLRRLGKACEEATRGGTELEFPEESEAKKQDREYKQRHYPHDQLQIRYVTEREARDRHERLKWQCLVPPRWRRFWLYTIGGDTTWE